MVLSVNSVAAVSVGASQPNPETRQTQNESAVSAEPFTEQTLINWQEKSFAGNTTYELVKEQNKTYLRGHAAGTASALFKKQKININNKPWLSWHWKINSTYGDIDERTKVGDDFPARLYVTAQVGLLPWDTVAINYVWSSNQTIDTFWESPYTNKSIIVAVQGGEQQVGKWVVQHRNIKNDFKQFFNVDVNNITGLAVMVDGDNTGKSGTAYFGKIEFSKNAE